MAPLAFGPPSKLLSVDALDVDIPLLLIASFQQMRANISTALLFAVVSFRILELEKLKADEEG